MDEKIIEKITDLVAIFVIMFLFAIIVFHHDTLYHAIFNSLGDGFGAMITLCLYWAWKWFVSPTKSY